MHLKMNIIVFFGVILLVGNRYVFEICNGPLEIASCSPTLVNVGPWHPKAMVVCASLYILDGDIGVTGISQLEILFFTHRCVSSVM